MEQEFKEILQRLESENNELREEIEAVKKKYEEKQDIMRGILERMSSAVKDYMTFQQNDHAAERGNKANQTMTEETDNQEHINETEKEVVKIVGSGVSVSRKICQTNDNLSGPTIFRCLLNLLNKGYLYSINRMKIIDGTYMTLYALTKKGREAYRSETGTEPAEPEMERLKSLYGTYQHGYSVFMCRNALEKIPVYSRVAIRTDESKDDTIEDIICFREDINGARIYEVFTVFEGFHKQGISFCFQQLNKCVNTAKSGDGDYPINIIVPDYDDAYRKATGIITEWAKKRLEIYPEDESVVFRLTRFGHLKEKTENELAAAGVYDIEKSLKEWPLTQPTCE